jgi:hypothetical protein
MTEANSKNFFGIIFFCYQHIASILDSGYADRGRELGQKSFMKLATAKDPEFVSTLA